MQITKKRLVSATQISLILSGRTILSNVNLTVSEGEIVTLIGPNGAGKSSLVKIVLGLLKPTHGEIDRQPDLKIGYMPQRIKITPLMPLSVERFLKQHPFLKPEKIEETLEELGIMKLLKYPMQDLSGGELQRVLLARALLKNPDLLVLDEPVQGVDITGQSELYQLIVKIRNHRNCGILLVSHDLHLVMAGTDTVICMNQHVCCSGHPQSVSQHPEFINLFGQTAIEGLAVYNHQHNHAHHLGGAVVNKEDPSCH